MTISEKYRELETTIHYAVYRKQYVYYYVKLITFVFFIQTNTVQFNWF